MVQEAVDLFDGEHEFLSNFFPCDVMFDGVIWRSVEHAYQAAKTDSSEWRTKIFGMVSPGKAKRTGMKVPLRRDWETVKVDIMEELVRDKFSRNPDLRQKLLDTGDAILSEGNTWGDRFWGQVSGKGRNELGKILMRVREELRNGV